MSQKPPVPPRSKEYLKYAGIGVQLVVYILIFMFAGYKIDESLESEKPWFTILLSVGGVVFSMVYLIRQFGRKS